MDSRLRLLVRHRAANTCEYCKLSEEDDAYTFHVEHVIPKKHGGLDDESNLALACHQCNLHKGTNISGIDPANHKMSALFHPRKQNWEDHFCFDGPHIKGITAEGRTTVQVLNMNDADRVQIRLLLESGGEE